MRAILEVQKEDSMTRGDIRAVAESRSYSVYNLPVFMASAAAHSPA